MKTSDIERLLIFRPGHLGDTLVALPAIWRLTETLPNAEISYLYNVDRRNPQYITPKDVISGTGLIDRWVGYPFHESQGPISRAFSRAALLLKLRRLKFDALAYLMPRERSLPQIKRDLGFFRTAGINKIIGVDHLLKSRFEINDLPASNRVQSESDFLQECLSFEGFSASEIQITDVLRITESEARNARAFVDETERSFVAVAPGSKRPSRMWNEERFAEVLERLVQSHDIYPIFFGSESEHDLCARIMDSCGVGQNFAAELSVRESAALLKCCDFYLGNDTGTMHLAAAVGTPCVAIFSAADRRGQWEPIGSNHKFIRKSVDCEGCRADLCPRENLCLQMIETDEVLNACVEMIDRNKAR